MRQRSLVIWISSACTSTRRAATWPTPVAVAAPVGMDELQTLIVAIRRFRAEHGVSPKRSIDLKIDDPESAASRWWQDQLAAMANVEAVYEGTPSSVTGHTRVTAGRMQAFIPLAGLVDVAAERPRLEKAIDETEKMLERSQAKLSNPKFAERAPADVVAGERTRVAEASAKLEKLRTQLAELE